MSETTSETCGMTYYGDECEVTGRHEWHTVTYPNSTSAQWTGESLPDEDRACGICGEREGSVYAKRCCENQDWVEV